MMNYERYYIPGVCVEYDETKAPKYALTDEIGLLHGVTHAAPLEVLNGWTVHEPEAWLGTSGGVWCLDGDVVRDM
jgi:hypothetical protein